MLTKTEERGTKKNLANWKKWNTKLEEFKQWRNEKRPRIELVYGDILRDFVFEEVPVALNKKEIVLDCGCGSGAYLLPIINEKNYIGIGVDPIRETSLNPLKCKVKQSNEPLYVIKAVGEYLPIKDSTIELVTLVSMFDHVTNPSKVIKEVTRVLNPSGLLLMLQTVSLGTSKKDMDELTHLHHFTMHDLNTLINANLRLLKHKFMYSFLIPFPFLPPFKYIPLISKNASISILKFYIFLGRLIRHPSMVLIKAEKSVLT
jgi:ubiquinone/menaquinone biosynthesis C-methylase UbiE